MITTIVVTETITRTAIGFETITNATNTITENTSERLIANEVAIIAITIITVPVTIIIGRVTAGPMITTTDHKTMMMIIIIVMTMIMVYGEPRFEQQQKKIASLNNGENTDTAADVDVDADGYFSNNDREEATDEANEAIELEWEDSACSAHSQCSSLEGMCCPTTDGSYLGCCDSYLPGGNDNSDANNGGNDVTSTTVQDIVAETGDKATEVESESKDAAACLAHSKCSNLEGLCCPTVDGTYLGCCDSNSGHNNAKDSFSHQWDELEKKSYTKYHNEGWSSF
jgi:hypothetical protein